MHNNANTERELLEIKPKTPIQRAVRTLGRPNNGQEDSVEVRQEMVKVVCDYIGNSFDKMVELISESSFRGFSSLT